MTKKILIDEAVVKQALEALESTGRFLHHCWCDVQMNEYSFDKLNKQMEIVDAEITALRGALEVNNKGVNALAEQSAQQAAESVARCPQDIIDAITAYGDARAGQDAINAPTTSHERLADCIRLVRGVLTKQMAPTQQDGTNGVVALQPLTDDELRNVLRNTNHMIRNAMYGSFWPELEQACRAIEAAHGITSTNKGE